MRAARGRVRPRFRVTIKSRVENIVDVLLADGYTPDEALKHIKYVIEHLEADYANQAKRPSSG